SEMALTGGVTSVLEMPTNRVTLSKHAIIEKIENARKNSIIDFGVHAGNMEKSFYGRIQEIKGLVKGIKGFLCAPYQLLDLDGFLSEASVNGIIPMLHCEDEEVLQKLKTEGSWDKILPENYPFLRPPNAERAAVEKAINAAQKLGVNLHIVHLSSKEGFSVVERNRNGKITVEVCPHHLIFTRKDLEKKGAFLKMNPPLREKEDINVLWDGLISGKIDFVATDHFYATYEEKEKNFIDAPAGIPSLEALLPLVYTFGVEKRGMPLERMVEVLSTKQASVFGLVNKGEIREGKDADIVFLNPHKKRKFVSKFWSPYEGMELNGYPEIVLLRGRVVMENGQMYEKPGYGRMLY
ncbi:MAG: dihydroorotase, partial [Thermoplasmata archaeon]